MFLLILFSLFFGGLEAVNVQTSPSPVANVFQSNSRATISSQNGSLVMSVSEGQDVVINASVGHVFVGNDTVITSSLLLAQLSPLISELVTLNGQLHPNITSLLSVISE